MLTEKADNIENKTRQDHIRIVRLKEGAEGNQQVLFFECWLPKILNLDTKQGVIKTDRAHRSLGLSREDPVRPVIIRLHNSRDKQRWGNNGRIFRHVEGATSPLQQGV